MFRVVYRRFRARVISVCPAWLLLRLVALYDYCFGEVELHFLSSIVPRGQDALDIGANYGVYSLFLSRLVENVYAYEPNPALARHLRRASPANVHVSETALSDKSGKAVLTVPIVEERALHGHGTLRQRERAGRDQLFNVSTSTLDEQNLGHIGFIKIDVEGHEEHVLRGGMNLVLRCRPRILVEIDAGYLSKPLADVVGFVEGLGYRTCYFRKAPGGVVERAETTAAEVGRGPLLHKCTGNFLFLPRESSTPVAALNNPV